LQEEPEKVALQRGDLLANNHLDAESVPLRHLLRRLCRVNSIVIRDRDQIKTNLFRASQDLGDRRRPIRSHRVNV
jgi:hypothetical protein